MENSRPRPVYIKYSTVIGYFLQDEPGTGMTRYVFDYTTKNFGLIDRTYDSDAEFDPQHQKTQWQRFEYQVSKFNRESDPRTQYKVLYMGRHGQGYHNVAEAFYGTDAWDCYWSHLDGNGTINWADAHLTPLGISQAQLGHTFWTSQIISQKIPVPEIYYSSPLTRCLQTAYHTFSNLSLPEAAAPFVPQVKELFREVMGVHTCDRRSKKSEIGKMFPEALFEMGFKENDELWRPDLRESDEAMDKRSKIVLDEVLGADRKTWLSITSHSGEIASILRVLGHKPFRLGTGQVIPVLVKAEWVDGLAPDVGDTPWMPVVKCDAPPHVREFTMLAVT